MISNKYEMTTEENIFCAKRILVDSVYKQANLEGIAVTFAQTQDILNNVNVNGITPNEISKVCCLRDGWHYLLDHLHKPTDLIFMEELHELVARFDVPYQYLGRLRTEDVLISGTSWRPEFPNADKIFRRLSELAKITDDTERALSIGLYIMRAQPFKDGNKRIGSFAINKELIEKGRGIFNVPVERDGQFKAMLVDYYETDNMGPLKKWIYDHCLDGTTLAPKIDAMPTKETLTARLAENQEKIRMQERNGTERTEPDRGDR